MPVDLLESPTSRRGNCSTSPLPSPGAKLKTGFFILEAINAFATAYYFYYLFFYLQTKLGFGNLGNLAFSAVNGFVYIFGAIYGGRFAQKHGYFLALSLGFGGMALALLAGLLFPTAWGQLAVLLCWTVSLCFTWPTLEALVSEGEDWHGLPRIVGLYNVVWATGTALAFFSGGALAQVLGWKSLFWLPAGLHVAQFGLTRWLAKKHGPTMTIAVSAGAGDQPGLTSDGAAPAPHPAAPTFQRMAWVANPLAYVAINTAVPLMPEIARRLDLSPMLAGFVCSAWMFARLGAFVVLWRWAAWHYRFGWLLSAYLLLIAGFAGLLLVPYFWVVMLAQLCFGWAIGLIYYSSLFYSMDASDTKGVHGGLHEAAIGVGIFAGPALGAAALEFFPQQANVSTWAVSGLLVVGAVVLTGLKRK